MKYLTACNLLTIGLFSTIFNYYSGASESMVNQENLDPNAQNIQKSKGLSSQNSSPCKLCMPSRSSQKKAKGNGDSLDQPAPVARKLFLSNEPEDGKNIDKALNISRQMKCKKQEKPKSNYLCAFLDLESNVLIDSSLLGILQEEIDSSNINEILNSRSSSTIFNLSLKHWPVERLYHMSFDPNMTKDIDEPTKEKLKSILNGVEFEFSKLETMGRFVVIKLKEPSIKENYMVSIEDMKFLKTYLEYQNTDPCMHISLIMVNSLKKEMQCIPSQKKQIETLLSDGHIDYKINKYENLKIQFSIKEVKRELSKFYLSYLFVISKDTRDYIFNTLDGNKCVLYPEIYNQAKSFQKTFIDLPKIAQFYFRKSYNIDYDFNGKIGIDFNGINSHSLDQVLINRLFSKIFLFNDDTDNKNRNPFINFQKITHFYIDKTLYRIKERENEIVNGKTIIDLDSFSFFDSQNQELSLEEKSLYEKQNKSDLLKIEKLESDLTLHLIMNCFFGLSLDVSFFEKFCDAHPDLVNEVINYAPEKHANSLGTILLNLDKIIPEATKGNFLDQKYEIKKDFNFSEIYHKNIIPFISFFGNAGQQLQEKVNKTAEEEIIHLENGKGRTKETIEFYNSKISNPFFWHKFYHILEEKLSKLLYGKKFSFNGLNVQPIEDENEDDI